MIKWPRNESHYGYTQGLGLLTFKNKSVIRV